MGASRIVAGGALVVFLLVACGSGGSSVNGGGGGAIACKQSGADGSDSDCTKQNMPRKMDCKSADEQNAALSAGCVKEHADDPSDFDACCPTTVTGGGGSSGGSGTTVACRQKSDADNNPECASFAGKPRKLDCDSSQTSAAVAAGCTKQSSTSSDVCCPTTVSGTSG